MIPQKLAFAIIFGVVALNVLSGLALPLTHGVDDSADVLRRTVSIPSVADSVGERREISSRASEKRPSDKLPLPSDRLFTQPDLSRKDAMKRKKSRPKSEAGSASGHDSNSDDESKAGDVKGPDFKPELPEIDTSPFMDSDTRIQLTGQATSLTRQKPVSTTRPMPKKEDPKQPKSDDGQKAHQNENSQGHTS